MSSVIYYQTSLSESERLIDFNKIHIKDCQRFLYDTNVKTTREYR